MRTLTKTDLEAIIKASYGVTTLALSRKIRCTQAEFDSSLIMIVSFDLDCAAGYQSRFPHLPSSCPASLPSIV